MGIEMIESLSLKFGSAPEQAPLSLQLAPVTIFVGPNNSGKSKVLKEIDRFCRKGHGHAQDVILSGLDFKGLDGEHATRFRDRVTLRPKKGEKVRDEQTVVGKGGTRHIVGQGALDGWIQNPNQDARHFCSLILTLYTLMVDGRNRIGLASDQTRADLQTSPTNHLDILFRDDEERNEVRRILHEAFDKYFVIDPTHGSQLRIRFSCTSPSPELERSLHNEAVEFHGQATHIDEFSDGVKAFTGMITQLVAGDPRVLLIDEPEAFLHPPLSSKLGKEITISACETGKSVFVSTHSSHFVMGCVQSGAPVNIVRLTYQNDVATARALTTEKLLRLIRHPLLRSTKVLEGLFYESVIVTESDADRAFYEEINTRLQRLNPPRGIPNCLFLNAQNKTTIHEIVRPLREMGIPAAGIVDVDILKDGGTDWTNFLGAGFVPATSHQGHGQIRSRVRHACDASGRNMKVDGGIGILPIDEQNAANDLFDQLAKYGLFAVRGGELESWLKHLDVTGHGPSWLISIFKKFGDDPGGANYVHPGNDDVWAFIDAIGEWLKDPNRKGIPD